MRYRCQRCGNPFEHEGPKPIEVCLECCKVVCDGPKIPGNCKQCKEPLSRFDMESWLKLCEAVGWDPLCAARTDPPGILCTRCWLDAMQEVAETRPDTRIAKMYRRAVSKARAEQLGIRVVR